MLGSNDSRDLKPRTLLRTASMWATLCGAFTIMVLATGCPILNPPTPCDSNSDCDDDVFCDGAETCVDGACQDGDAPCSGATPFCDEGANACVECNSDDDCDDDGVFCNGEESCDDAAGECVSSGDPCEEGEVCLEASDTCADGDTARFAVFDDPDSTFTTIDVNDVDEEIVRFDAELKSITWAADDREFQQGFWTIDGNMIGNFLVRFGTKDGQRRAYFTEVGPATICDLAVVGETLTISPTQTLVPQE